MARGLDWATFRRLAETELKAGETIRTAFPALAPDDADDEGLVPAWLIPVLAAIDRFLWHRKTRQAAKDSIFPMAPRMLVGLTSHRMLVWAASRRFQPGPFIGYVTLDRIVQAETVTVGAGLRTIRIDLANEPSVRLRVAGTIAEELAAMLSGKTVAPGED